MPVPMRKNRVAPPPAECPLTAVHERHRWRVEATHHLVPT